jgi:hypothetical protein
MRAILFGNGKRGQRHYSTILQNWLYLADMKKGGVHNLIEVNSGCIREVSNLVKKLK